MGNILIEKNEPLTSEDKKLFAYFGENSKIIPPFRILNPQNIYIGDRVSIRECAYIHAYIDLSELMQYIDPKYINDFRKEDYLSESSIRIEDENQIGRNLYMVCNNSIVIERNCTIGERVFIGDYNHSTAHPHVPIMQQPQLKGNPVLIKRGSWIGVGAAILGGGPAILGGTVLGMNTSVGANCVVQGQYPDYAVIAMPKAKMVYRTFDPEREP